MTARAAAVRLLALLALAAGWPASAHAGSYTTYSCRAPGGGAASTEGWSFSAYNTSVDLFSDSCPNVGLMAVMASGVVHARDDVLRLQYFAPPSTHIVRFTLWRSAVVAYGTEYYFTPLETRGGVEAGIKPACKGSEGCSGFGDPAVPLGPANRYERVPPLPLDSFGVYLSCGYHGAGTPDCPASSPVAVGAAIYRADVSLADDLAPVLATDPAGGLLDGSAPLSGVQEVSVLAGDQGGGIADTAIEVDGHAVVHGKLDDDRGTCHAPYLVPVPCPLAVSGTIRFDTSTLSDGAHQVRVVVTDVAGNQTASKPVAISTDNVSINCNPEPRLRNGPFVLRTWFGQTAHARRHRHRAHRIVLRQGGTATLHGRISVNGAPLAGASICVAMRPLGSDRAPTQLASLRTGANGGFTASIPAGPSREVWAIHRATGAAVVTRALVRIRARVALHADRTRLDGGELLTLHGRVRGGPIPRSGVLVSIQARRGRSWQTFEQVRARRRGRFRVRYRFHGAPGLHSYALRAYVPSQSGYPYMAAASRSLSVTVRG